MSQTPTPNPNSPPNDVPACPPGYVPQARLDAVLAAKDKAERDLARLEKRWETREAELTAALATAEQAREMDRVLAAAGLDPTSSEAAELTDYLQMRHERLPAPEDGKAKPSLSELFGTLREAKNPILSALIRPGVAGRKPTDAPAAPAAKGQAPPAPPPPAAPPTQPRGTTTLTPEDLAHMDAAQWKESKGQIFADIAKLPMGER